MEAATVLQYKVLLGYVHSTFLVLSSPCNECEQVARGQGVRGGRAKSSQALIACRFEGDRSKP